MNLCLQPLLSFYQRVTMAEAWVPCYAFSSAQSITTT